MSNPELEAILREARLRDARAAYARAKGRLEVTCEMARTVAVENQKANADTQKAYAEIIALETDPAAAGPLSSYGQYSTVDQALRAERFLGKAASVDFVKAHPECTEQEAITAWEAACILEATGLPAVVQSPAILGQIYRANLLKAGLVPDATWESQRAWILATPKETIMGA